MSKNNSSDIPNGIKYAIAILVSIIASASVTFIIYCILNTLNLLTVDWLLICVFINWFVDWFTDYKKAIKEGKI